jgi:hypothetical protein
MVAWSRARAFASPASGSPIVVDLTMHLPISAPGGFLKQSIHWLFGGSSGSGSFNDLWRYTPSTGFWTWVSGSNSQNAVGVYGTPGTAAAGNVPGARQESVSWTDKAGYLWLFGGYGYNASNSYLNDLWRYSTSTGLWTWVGGSTGSNAIGVYGTLGVAAPGNVPGARTGSVSWTDPSGNFWLFGGSNSAGSFNDLWRYSPTTGLWAWMSGANVTGADGVYGTQGTAAPGNTPGSRQNALSWADSAGNLWLFGGSFFNDLWEYSGSTGLWTWMGGATQTKQGLRHPGGGGARKHSWSARQLHDLGRWRRQFLAVRRRCLPQRRSTLPGPHQRSVEVCSARSIGFSVPPPGSST